MEKAAREKLMRVVEAQLQDIEKSKRLLHLRKEKLHLEAQQARSKELIDMLDLGHDNAIFISEVRGDRISLSIGNRWYLIEKDIVFGPEEEVNVNELGLMDQDIITTIQNRFDELIAFKQKVERGESE